MVKLGLISMGLDQNQVTLLGQTGGQVVTHYAECTESKRILATWELVTTRLQQQSSEGSEVLNSSVNAWFSQDSMLYQ